MTFSIIIPARNAAIDLPYLFAALLPQLRPDDECILVNDASTDSTPRVAGGYPVRIFSVESRSGPAAARNLGARQASGEILVFLDADVVPHADLMKRLTGHFNADEVLAAVIGSYDDHPLSSAVVSRFRNLLHCYTHRTGNPRASTFWAGCGAIRRRVFEASEGFNALRFPQPSIEDIELGVRLRRSGAFILLDPDLQVQHRKVWSLASMVRTDVWSRAVPWSELIMESRQAPVDLNLKVSQRYCAAATVLALVLIPFLAWKPLAPGAAVLLLLASVVLLNWRFYDFLRNRGGWGFALCSIPLHFLYFLSSVVGFGVAAWRRIIRGASLC